MIFYCLHNLNTLKLLKAEVCTAFNNVEDICIEQHLNFCYYLRVCINKSMQLSSSLDVILPRQALLEDIHVDEYFFSEEMKMRISIYALHHQECFHFNVFIFKSAH